MSGGELYDSIDEWLALSPEEKLARYKALADRTNAEHEAKFGPLEPGDVSAVKARFPVDSRVIGREGPGGTVHAVEPDEATSDHVAGEDGR